MTSIRSLKDIQGLSWQSSDLIESITDRLNLFVFSYSHELQALTTWSSNCKSILGISDQEVIASGNIFLKHTHKDDRFKLMQKLEFLIIKRDAK